MARAYVLIEIAAGKTAGVVQALRKLPGVTAADAITGPYDVVAVLEGRDANEIGKLVMNQVHGIEGVNRTLTCLVMQGASI